MFVQWPAGGVPVNGGGANGVCLRHVIQSEMTESRAESDLSLSEFLSSRARHASDARLALDVACGFVVAVAAALWHGPGWHLITPAAVCFLAYGAWGIADRELLERPDASVRIRVLLQWARRVAVVIGLGAAITLVLTGMAVALGSVKS